mgnify:FL=1
MISSGVQQLSPINKIIKRSHQTLIKKYEKMPLKYNSNIIDNIIYNERAHIVAEFKDRLIIDDNGEFLKRYYNLDESFVRLPKFFEYYELYSKIFPNYTAIYESKYLYQNIQKKQKMIDQQEQIEIEKQKMKDKEENSLVKKLDLDSEYKEDYTNERNKKSNENIFSTDIINSILSKSNTEQIEILFSINKENISKEEKAFQEDVQHIVLSINKYDEKKEKESSKKEKSDKKKESHSGKKNRINNTVLGNDINKIVKLNYFNKNIFRKKNTIFNINNEKISNNSINNKINNINKIGKNDINLIKLIENNIFKKKKKNSKQNNKNIFHNISSSTSLKKDLSKTKLNSRDKTKRLSCYSLNILNNINVSFPQRIINYNIINPNLKNNIKTSKPITTRKKQKNVLNFSLDKKKINKTNKMNMLKYTQSSNNICEIKKCKRSTSNDDKSRKKSKGKNTPTSFRKNNIINQNIQKVTNNIKKLNGRKISYNNFNKISKYKNNTYFLIDSRNFILNNFLKTYRHRKSSSHRKRSARSISSSAHDASKSRPKSNKKNESKNNIFELNNTSKIIKKKNIIKNMNMTNITNVRNMKPIKNNKKNIVNKFNWKIDSRNRKSILGSKNFFKSKTKNILFPNESSLKMSFLSAINQIKNDSKNKDKKKYTDLSNKNLYK